MLLPLGHARLVGLVGREGYERLVVTELVRLVECVGHVHVRLVGRVGLVVF